MQTASSTILETRANPKGLTARGERTKRAGAQKMVQEGRESWYYISQNARGTTTMWWSDERGTETRVVRHNGADF